MEFVMAVLAAMVPLLVAVDPAAGVLVFISLTDHLEPRARKKVLRDGVVTALAVGVGFLFLGAAIFRLLGIIEADFQIGGGLILVVLSLADLTAGDRSRRRWDEFVGVVPIGTPLLVGPAVLTALSLLQKQFGNAVTLTAFVTTLAATALALIFSQQISRLVATGGLKAVSKIISILLVGFGIHLIRVGVMTILEVAPLIASQPPIPAP